ncbi:hypothetical protein ACTU3M_10315 [Bacillus subtilis]|uniref:hypothetical protein n=1 Tax=Bacillus subtilis TaxID=1423 RepID=UPI0007E9C268|nr:hypothetical protein A9D36_10260 [Bacillus subtilis]
MAEDKILQEIKDIEESIFTGLLRIKSELDSFREETKKEFKKINVKLDRIEKNGSQELLSMLKVISKNMQIDHSYNDKKFSSLERRIHELEEKLNN